MSSYRRSRRCPRCKKLRPAESYDGRTRRFKVCRVCRKLATAKAARDRKVINILAAFGDLDPELHAALGQQWPRKLLKAKDGGYVR
jgi:hypothetical protein